MTELAAADLPWKREFAPGDLVVFDPATAERRVVEGGGSHLEPTWDSDGERIAFISDRDDSHGEIYVIGVDGGKLLRLTDNHGVEAMLDWSARS